MLDFKVGDEVLYTPGLEQIQVLEEGMVTVAAPDGNLYSVSEVMMGLACRTVVATFPLFMVKSHVTDEIFEDWPECYVLAPAE
jgi:hypothetical protein